MTGAQTPQPSENNTTGLFTLEIMAGMALQKLVYQQLGGDGMNDPVILPHSAQQRRKHIVAVITV